MKELFVPKGEQKNYNPEKKKTEKRKVHVSTQFLSYFITYQNTNINILAKKILQN